MSQSTLSTCAEELEAHLNDETALYEQLCEIARAAELAARQPDGEAVSELMNKKQEVVAELQRISKVTDRLRKDFAGYPEVPDEIHARVLEALGRAEAVLVKLLDIERASEKPLLAMRDSIQAELHEVARGRQSLQGYRPKRETEPRFMDKRR